MLVIPWHCNRLDYSCRLPKSEEFTRCWQSGAVGDDAQSKSSSLWWDNSDMRLQSCTLADLSCRDCDLLSTVSEQHSHLGLSQGIRCRRYSETMAACSAADPTLKVGASSFSKVDPEAKLHPADQVAYEVLVQLILE